MAARCWGTRFCSPVPAEALSLDTDPLLFHQLHGQELSVTGGAGEGNRRGYCSWQSRYFQSTSITCCTLNPFRSSQGRDFSAQNASSFSVPVSTHSLITHLQFTWKVLPTIWVHCCHLHPTLPEDHTASRAAWGLPSGSSSTQWDLILIRNVTLTSVGHFENYVRSCCLI